MKRVVVPIVCFALSACVTTDASDSKSEISGGYFVALAAESSSEQTLALYDGLHDAIDAHNRRIADREGRLAAYVEAFESDGYTRMADGRNEIECDLAKCLVKLTSKTLSSAPKDDRALGG